MPRPFSLDMEKLYEYIKSHDWYDCYIDNMAKHFNVSQPCVYNGVRALQRANRIIVRRKLAKMYFYGTTLETTTPPVQSKEEPRSSPFTGLVKDLFGTIEPKKPEVV
jgi:hypothetical protein